jgi:large subunit ribosomal protein L4
MPTVKVRNLKNKEVGDVELLDSVFGVELNESLIHAAVVNYQANGRQGTSATKTRGNVSGSGRKLWKQKGTGRARIASLRSPLWKGGGNVHGPQPRDWSYQMPKKMRRGALRSALSERLREGNLIVIDEFAIAAPKTKEFIGAIEGLKLSDDKRKAVKTLIVDSLDNSNLILSSRNVEKTKVTNSFGLNIYDILYHEKLLISKSAAAELNELLDPKREGAKDSEEVPVKEAKPKKAKAPAAEAVAEPVKEEAPKAAKPKKETAAEEAPKAEKPAKKEAAADEALKAAKPKKAAAEEVKAEKPKKEAAPAKEKAPKKADKEATDNE